MFSSIHRRPLLSPQPFSWLHCKTFQKHPPCVDPATISHFKTPNQFSPPFIRSGSIQPRLSPRSLRELHLNVIDPTINQPRLQIGYILELFFDSDAGGHLFLQAHSIGEEVTDRLHIAPKSKMKCPDCLSPSIYCLWFAFQCHLHS